MSLADLQQHMMGFLLDEASGTKPNTSSHLSVLQTMVSASSPPEGLQIYSHAYRARLIEVLGNDHEKLKIFLGATEFTRLAGEFVAHNPSTVRSLRYYAEALPKFLSTSNHAKADIAAQLGDFERTLMDVYDAPFGEQPGSDLLQTLAPDDWPTMTLAAHPSVRVFADNTRAIPMWQHCNTSEQQDDAVAAPRKPDLKDADTDFWILWRDRTRVCQFRHLENAEHAALQLMLIEGKTLAATAEALMPHVAAEKLAPSLQHWLNQWLGDGLIQDIDSA